MGVGRKRRRVGGGELARAAEMVMVLAASGEARGGGAPTAAERALVAQARGALAAAVAGEAGLRPRDLFPREAVRALVEDLGLTRARDLPAVGYRPRKASIAQRALLTKRKMEEVKEALVSSTMPKTRASNATGFPHAALNLPAPTAPAVISKQPLLNGTVAGASSVKAHDIPSTVSLAPVGSADIKVESVVNGSNFTLNGGAGTIGQLNESGQHTAHSSNQNCIQSSSQPEKSLDKRGPAICPAKGTVVMGYQAPRGELSNQKQSIFSNHKAIAKNVERILHQPVGHSSWTIPSIEYMNTRLDCQICKVPITEKELLVCDACERGMHLKCLQCYGNQGVPKNEWYCPTCVARSKGKTLPPRYGKVTRTIVAPKISMTSARHPSSQGSAVNPNKNDDCSKNVAASQSVIDQKSQKVGSAEHKSDTLALDTSSKSLSISSAEPQKENVKHDHILSLEKEGNAQCCGGTLTETVKFYKEVKGTGTSTCGCGNFSGGTHIPIENRYVSSMNDATLKCTTLPNLKHPDHSFIVSSVGNRERDGTSFQHPSKNVQIDSNRTPADEIQQADGVTNNGIGMPIKQETFTEDAISDHGKAHVAILKEHICSKHEVVGDHKDAYVGCSTASIVEWVGGALKALDNKTYYNSCKVDGVIYNLHDHILIASEGSKPGPCKLQSLWQDHDSGSKLAMVNPFFFGSDIPETISKPCTDEENEVYGSNDELTVSVSAICGRCEVLHFDKFREETKTRFQLDSSSCRLHPIFLCRWKYDDSTSSFYQDYNVDS